VAVAIGPGALPLVRDVSRRGNERHRQSGERSRHALRGHRGSVFTVAAGRAGGGRTCAERKPNATGPGTVLQVERQRAVSDPRRKLGTPAGGFDTRSNAGRIAASGASRHCLGSRRRSAFLITEPARSRRGGNWSSCPQADPRHQLCGRLMARRIATSPCPWRHRLHQRCGLKLGIICPPTSRLASAASQRTWAAGSQSPMGEDQIHRAEIGQLRATCRRSTFRAIIFDNPAAKET
jgi:hypothetical protein